MDLETKIRNLIDENYVINNILEITDLGIRSHQHFQIKTSDNQYILRKYMDNFYINPNHYKLELEFLSYLKKENVHIAAPIKTKAGKYHCFNQEQVYAIFEFAEGERTNFSEDQMFIYGKELAKLHFAANKFDDNSAHEFNDRGYGFLVEDAYNILSDPVFQDKKYEKSFKLFQYFLDVLERSKSILPNSEITTSIIHADSHFGNVVFDENNYMMFFDFDFIGRGYSIYDIATGLWGIINKNIENFEKLKKSLIQGYQSVLELKLEDLELLTLIMELRIIETCVFHIKLDRERKRDIDQDYFEFWIKICFEKFLPLINK